MERQTNGPGSDPSGADGAETALDVERLRGMAGDVMRNADEYVKRARELVVRYPVYSVAGAVVAGFVFAKLVAKKR